jgi:2-dehydro-3-deoxygluconokinase
MEAPPRLEIRPCDALCLGETMVLVTPTVGGRLDASSSFVLRAGGAESNVAMYLSDLGHRSVWLSRIGADPLGQLLLDQIGSTGVDTSAVIVDPHHPTGVFFKDPSPEQTRVFYYRKSSAASRMSRELIGTVLSSPPKVLHLTGITPALSSTCRDLIDHLVFDRPLGETLISLDVNYRASLWPSHPGEYLRRLAQAADVVFVGLDEAEALWGSQTAADVRATVSFPETLVVKNGGGDATSFHQEGQDSVAAPHVDIIDPVGAGDAFAAGWLSGMLRGLDQQNRLRLGHAVAGVALRSTGDHATLPPFERLMVPFSSIPRDPRDGAPEELRSRRA